MTQIVTRRWAMPGFGALVLGLALMTSGCAGDTSMSAGPDGQFDADDLFDSYDSNGDDMFGRPEWDQIHIDLDTDGDGAVSRDELNAGLRGDGR